jgi:hypothetical protein
VVAVVDVVVEEEEEGEEEEEEVWWWKWWWWLWWFRLFVVVVVAVVVVVVVRSLEGLWDPAIGFPLTVVCSCNQRFEPLCPVHLHCFFLPYFCWRDRVLGECISSATRNKRIRRSRRHQYRPRKVGVV